MKKVLITGASEKVATELIKNLSEEGKFEIYAASSKQINLIADTVHYVANTCIESAMQQNEFDCLVHCAFPRNVNDLKWASGISYGYDVLFFAKKYRINRIIHISSQSIYGWRRNSSAIEGDSISLNNPYGTGKYCTELLVNHLFADRPHTNIRLATIIGVNAPERVPNKLFHQLISEKDLHIQGGEQVFSFLDIRDAGCALSKLVCSSKTDWREVYNIGTEEYYTLSEIADFCLEIAKEQGNCNSKIETLPSNIVLNNRLNCSAFYEDFGWRANYSLKESLNTIYEALCNM